jgi:hypothetical protein
MGISFSECQECFLFVMPGEKKVYTGTPWGAKRKNARPGTRSSVPGAGDEGSRIQNGATGQTEAARRL